MHDLALYRKYRPTKFKEVLGQDHIVNILESSVETNKVSHAYLFVGTRGTGKTSVARIFATNIGVSANDLYEIDAASNRGIEDIKNFATAREFYLLIQNIKFTLLTRCICFRKMLGARY